ncbi:hypothetical protein ACTXT7_016440 [Hymenolepis weldensis]
MKKAPTTLHEAIAQRDVTSIRDLIDNKKVNPSFFPDNPTTTPIIEAMKVKCPYIMFLLHNRGADLTRTDNNGRNALHHAALRNDIISINFLINRKCPKDARDNSGFTPLVMAIRNNNLANVRFLVKNGVAVYPEKGPLHSMPLVAAAYFCGTPLIRWNLTDQSPLEFAILSDNRDIASLLISSGVCVYDRDHQGYTALMHSAISDSPYVTSLLLSYGADPSITANDMRTTVDTIVQNLGSDKVAKILSVWKHDVMNSILGR